MAGLDKSLEERTPEEALALLSIKKTSDIKTMEYIDDFQDDHIVCVVGLINNIRFTFWWCGPSLVGAFQYGEDNEKAKKQILTTLKGNLECDIQSMFDKNDEELLESITAHRETYQVVLDHIHNSPKHSYVKGYILQWKDELSAFIDFDTYKLIC